MCLFVLLHSCVTQPDYKVQGELVSVAAGLDGARQSEMAGPAVLLLLCLVRGGRSLTITQQPRDQVVTRGGAAFLSCSFSSPSPLPPTVTWYKEGALVERGQTRSDGSLVLTGVTARDSGRYHCRLSSSLGSVQSRPALLTVRERQERPEITHRPLQTRVVRGERIVLDCLASGYPPPSYAWYKDGGRLSAAHDRFSIAPNGSLVIENAQLEDGAHYRCSASNYLGRAGSSARVIVETDEPARAPVITTRPRSVVVVEGGIMEMTCVAGGAPQPGITWWNNNRLVATTGRVTVSNTGHHLRIQDLEVWDSGPYTCLAENSVGRQSLTARLTVISEVELAGQQGQTVSSPSTEPHQTMEATRGSTVQLQCGPGELVGQGVVWEREGAVMGGGGRHRLGADGSLVIFNVSSADSGRYECTVREGGQTRTVRTAFSVLTEGRDGSFSGHTGLPGLHVEDQSYFSSYNTETDTETETEIEIETEI